MSWQNQNKSSNSATKSTIDQPHLSEISCITKAALVSVYLMNCLESGDVSQKFPQAYKRPLDHLHRRREGEGDKKKIFCLFVVVEAAFA